MPTNPLTLANDRSIKLSVTVRSCLEAKYDPAALNKISAAIERWRTADSKRGISTLHIAVDDPEDLKDWGVAAVSGKATPGKIKRVIDDLWKQITPTPHYLVLFGGHDIVPMFTVTNPTYLWQSGDDDDKTVLTDNPYASCAPFSKDDQNSYEVPDRVIGRIPDMVSAPGDTSRNGDPAWFTDYLKTATNWEPNPDSFYTTPYVICTDEAKEAGKKCVPKAFPQPTLPPLVCPPDSDTSTPRDRLSSPLHMIKCHGNKKDATFWGFPESDKDKEERCPAITSTTLKECVQPGTVVATMCCYGAQIFSPKEADTWPLASTYLRKGALGYVGSTMMAWVGLDKMSGADWIVTGYLKSVLEGESMGFALLKSKQDYHRHDGIRGPSTDVVGEKTVIEYVLLGDPSIHPVSGSQSFVGTLAAQERQQRRVAGAMVATGIRKLLPTRSPATHEEEAYATKVFASDIAQDALKNLKGFRFEPEAARVQRLDTDFPDPSETTRGPIQRRQSLEYYWSGRRVRGEQNQLCLLRAETDLEGRPCRASVMHTS
jgi:hypothetical protein